MLLIEEYSNVRFGCIQRIDVFPHIMVVRTRIIDPFGHRMCGFRYLQIQSIESLQTPFDQRCEIVISSEDRVGHDKIVIIIRACEHVPERIRHTSVRTAKVCTDVVCLYRILDLIELLAVGCVPVDLYRDEISFGYHFDSISKEQRILIQVCIVIIVIVQLKTLRLYDPDGFIHQETIHCPDGYVHVFHTVFLLDALW